MAKRTIYLKCLLNILKIVLNVFKILITKIKQKKMLKRIKNTKFLRHGGVINMLRIILMHLILNYQFENVENVKIILHLL